MSANVQRIACIIRYGILFELRPALILFADVENDE
jgi:hypothetical protein